GSAPPQYITVVIPDFSLAPTNGFSLLATAGQPASVQLTVSPLSSTPSTVNLSLFNASSVWGYAVSLNPAQVSLNNAPATTMLTMTPTASAPASAIRRPAGSVVLLYRLSAGPPSNGWKVRLVLVIASLLAVIGLKVRRFRV